MRLGRTQKKTPPQEEKPQTHRNQLILRRVFVYPNTSHLTYCKGVRDNHKERSGLSQRALWTYNCHPANQQVAS